MWDDDNYEEGMPEPNWHQELAVLAGLAILLVSILMRWL